MKQVTIEKEKLLEKLKENREIHEKEYTELHNAYLDSVISGLKELLEEAEKRPTSPTTGLHLHVPRSYLKEYDMVIGMLEFSEEEAFQITQDEYKKFILNEWEWTGMFDSMKATYLSKGN